MMSLANDILSDLTIHMKYAKYIESKQRRETWSELIYRNMQMHIKTYPKLREQIENAYSIHVSEKKVLPSMRSLQFGGKPIEVAPNRIYNCAYMPVDCLDAFWEAMFLLLGGTGVGYSVQFHHIEQLPEIHHPNKNRTRRFICHNCCACM